MKLKCALLAMMMCSNFAFALDLGYVSTDPTEKAQIATLEKNLAEINGIQTTVRFTSEFLSPMASYNRITTAAQAFLNLGRSSDAKILGAGARAVIVDLGSIVYQCQALVEFKGGLDDSNLTYAGLNACVGAYTQVARDMDTTCWLQKQKNPKFTCPKLDTYLPSALYLEVRR